jgi:hypothetical protein
MINNLKLLSPTTNETEFMDEEEYINIDNPIKKIPLLSFEDIAEIVKNEHIEESRSHRKKEKDKGINVFFFLIRVSRKRKGKFTGTEKIQGVRRIFRCRKLDKRKTLFFFFFKKTLF